MIVSELLSSDETCPGVRGVRPYSGARYRTTEDQGPGAEQEWIIIRSSSSSTISVSISVQVSTVKHHWDFTQLKSNYREVTN